MIDKELDMIVLGFERGVWYFFFFNIGGEKFFILIRKYRKYLLFINYKENYVFIFYSELCFYG